MKPIYRILFCVMCLLPGVGHAAPVATTAGSNLTAYNPSSMGSVNNNQWNNMLNSRNGTDTVPTADFGNCNALIMRCASPKCATGGCTSMDVTVPIVNGCVNTNSACKQYGNDLVQSIAAQIVANSNARASQAAANAASAATAQSNQQLAQMQAEMNAQMQQMQQQMQAQNAQTVAQLQAALEEQKQMTAAAQQQIADAQIAQNSANDSGLTAAQQEAVARGVDTELMVRDQINGQIMSKLENVEVALKNMYATMGDVFKYAKCDERGNNCEGPKRVKAFKQKAMNFFDPYNDVLDELYDALITAQAVGVDINDIYMLLNGSCNVWGEYLCSGVAERTCVHGEDDKSGICKGDGSYHWSWPKYGTDECPDGKTAAAGDSVSAGLECSTNMVIPPENLRGCVLQRTLTDGDDVQRAWLDAQSGDNMIRIGCASSALENSAFFRSRKKQSQIDIELLERLVLQDAPTGKDQSNGSQYCGAPNESVELQKYVSSKTLPKGGKMCCDKGKCGTLTECDWENTVAKELIIDPTIALCSTHAYNVSNNNSNPIDEEGRAEMREIIALKTTVMTQQMNKQYEYMESMIRRFKSQLEKAVLKTKLNVASGASDSEKSSKAEEKQAWKNEVKNCNTSSTSDSALLDCYESNINVFRNELNANGATSGLRSEMNKAYTALTKEKFSSGTDYTCEAACSQGMRTKQSDFETCLDSMNKCLRTKRRDLQNFNATLGKDDK